MIYIKNKIIPFGRFTAITIWPFVFYKKLGKYTRNHEAIHGRQQLELLVIPFYVIYIIEAIFKGYRNISFEREAYCNDDNDNYLKNRKPYAMWRN
jgi:hypothetical protein